MSGVPGPPPASGIVARLAGVGLSYGRTRALDDVSLDIPAGRMVGLIGPDGVGKSSLLALVAGAHAIQQGRIEVLGGDMADAGHADALPAHRLHAAEPRRTLSDAVGVRERRFFGPLSATAAREARASHRRIASDHRLASFATVSRLMSGCLKQKLRL